MTAEVLMCAKPEVARPGIKGSALVAMKERVRLIRGSPQDPEPKGKGTEHNFYYSY
jgi:hypothetical protein